MDDLSLPRRLGAGPLIGTFIKVPRREVVDLLAQSGVDFLICDMEHGQVSEREACDVIVAGHAAALPVVVRIGSLDPALINRLLEWGAAGIQVPHVTDLATSRSARNAMRYPPEGTRSASLAQPAARYGHDPASEYLSRANAGTVVVGQHETMQYTDDVSTIIEQLDVAFIGTFDLSVDAGHPGHLDPPAVKAVIERIEKAARQSGTALGRFAATPEACRAAVAAGYDYIAYGSDLAMLRQSAEHVRETLAAAREGVLP